MVVLSFPVSANAPVVYPLISCEECKEEVTFGCLVTDFFPEPVTVSWVSDVSGDAVTFPAIQGSNSHYSLSSQLTIPASSLEGNAFQCRVNYGATDKTITEDIQGDGLCQSPDLTMNLLSDPNKYYQEDKILLLCLIEGNKATEAHVEWLVNNEVTNLQQEDNSCDQCSQDKATFTSQVNVSRQSWDLGAEFSCRVTHRFLKSPSVLNISTFCSGVQPELEVTILPPSLEDLYLSQNASITCVATNVKTPEDVKFSWTREKGSPLDVTTREPESLQNGLYHISSVLKICAEEWNSGEKFTCTIKVPELDESVTRSIKKDIAVSVKAPSVYVFPPAAEELARQETATLTCMILDFHPRDILVTWTQEDRPVTPGSFSNFGPQKEGDTFALYSKLSVPAEAWRRGDSFACVVGHDGIPMNFLQKNLDKTAGKPATVNVSVVLTDADVTCY